MVLQVKPRLDAVESTKVSECEVQSWAIDLGPPGQGMFVIGLEVFHRQQVPMAKAHRPGFSGAALADSEVAFGAQAD